MRIKGTEKRKRLYAIGCLLATILIIGTGGAMELDTIGFGQGCWQVVCGVALGLWCWNGLRLEETRAARSPRMW
jgi:hypothetical protein